VVLELGKSGSAGAEKGVCPVLRDGAVVGEREWTFATHTGTAAMGAAASAAVIGGST
jgi:hypothetical protein